MLYRISNGNANGTWMLTPCWTSSWDAKWIWGTWIHCWMFFGDGVIAGRRKAIVRPAVCEKRIWISVAKTVVWKFLLHRILETFCCCGRKLDQRKMIWTFSHPVACLVAVGVVSQRTIAKRAWIWACGCLGNHCLGFLPRLRRMNRNAKSVPYNRCAFWDWYKYWLSYSVVRQLPASGSGDVIPIARPKSPSCLGGHDDRHRCVSCVSCGLLVGTLFERSPIFARGTGAEDAAGGITW